MFWAPKHDGLDACRGLMAALLLEGIAAFILWLLWELIK